jgi:hypothetical protein
MDFRLEDVLQLLSATPQVIGQCFEQMPAHYSLKNEGQGTWSPFDVLGHLVHGEKTDWIPRAKIILEQGEAHPFDPFDRFAMLESSKGKTAEDLLREFKEIRQQNLQTLRSWNLTPTDLQKTGVHPALGRVTLQQLLSTWVVHDLDHMSQIVRTVAKQLDGEVGPWRAYLSVLTNRHS